MPGGRDWARTHRLATIGAVTTAAPLLRLATADDLPIIQALMVQTWHDLFEGLSREGKLSARYHTPPRLQDELDDPAQQLLVVELGGELVATATGRRTDAGVYEIERIYVRPSMQGQGLGALLLERILADCGDQPVRVELDARNHRAIEFYAEHGFVLVGERERGELPPKLVYVVMRRDPGAPGRA